MSDGLTVPFALAAGLSSAVSSNKIVITAGIAEIVAGCIAMGLGGYLAGKTEQEHYQSELEKDVNKILFCPGTQSMWFIVASPSCTQYLWGTLIAF